MSKRTPEDLLSELGTLRNILASKIPAALRDANLSIAVSIEITGYSKEEVREISQAFGKTTTKWWISPLEEGHYRISQYVFPQR